MPILSPLNKFYNKTFELEVAISSSPSTGDVLTPSTVEITSLLPLIFLKIYSDIIHILGFGYLSYFFSSFNSFSYNISASFYYIVHLLNFSVISAL